MTRFERATNSLEGCDSTVELHPHETIINHFGLIVNDSSRIRTYDRLLRRQLLYPAELLSHYDNHTLCSGDCQVGNGGFEPPTSALSAHCSTAELISQGGQGGI